LVRWPAHDARADVSGVGHGWLENIPEGCDRFDMGLVWTEWTSKTKKPLILANQRLRIWLRGQDLNL
jgi:hypothetical protein